MKFFKIILVSIILLTLTLGAVSADDNVTSVDDIVGSDELISDYEYEVEIPESISDDDVWTVDVKKMPNDASGNISISVDEKEHYNQKVSPGGNALILNDLKLDDGIHSACVKYSGDNKYAGFIKNSTFEKSFLRLVGLSGEFKSDYLFHVETDNGVTGNIKVLIDGKTVLNEKCDGYKKNVYADGISYGKHTYEVKYTGGNHNDLVKKGSFTHDTDFDVECFNTNISAGEYVEFTIYGGYGDELTCNVNINGKKYKKLTFECHDSLYISDFDVGENIVEFTTIYKSIKNSRSVKINVEPILTVPKTVMYGKSDEVVLIVTNSTAGDLNVKVDGVEYGSVKITNGKSAVALENLSVGGHILTISSGPTGEKNCTVDVVPYLTTNKYYANTSDLVFKSSADFNGDLTVSGIVNTKVKVENGSASIPVPPLGSGQYKINITYGNTTWEYILKIHKNSPDLDIELSFPEKIHLSDRFSYDGPHDYLEISDVPEEFSGNLSIYHDGVLVGKYLDYDPAWDGIDGAEEADGMRISPKSLKAGKHNITVKYDGDDYFNPFNKTITYTASKLILLEYRNEYKKLFIRVPKGTTGTATIKVDGKKVGTIKLSQKNDDPDVHTDWYGMSLSSLEYGKPYEIEVSYSGNYGKETVKETINLDYEFYIICPDFFNYGSKNNVYFVMPGDAKSSPTVEIDGVNYKYTKDYAVDVSKLKSGVHNIVVNYPGDKTYPAKSVNKTFYVGADIKVTGKLALNSKIAASLTLPDDATGDLIVEIDSKFYKSTPIKDGKATINLPSCNVGKYSYSAYFIGNYPVNSDNGTICIEPTWKLSTAINPSNNAKLTLGLGNDTKGHVVMFAYGIPIAEFDVDSKNNVININKTLLSKVKSIVDVFGSDGYSKLDFNFVLFVNNVYIDEFSKNAKLTGQIESKDITMNYNDGSKLKIKVRDWFGEVAKNALITVKIKNKYTIRTNADGMATLKIADVPGKYNAEIRYCGISVTKKVNVKQILTLKKVKVKKSAKKLVLTAKLSKKLKGKKITFKFNGKKYKVKTDKKGVAKVTIKKSVLKKLKVGKKITYTATYVKDTVKQSVKVKK